MGYHVYILRTKGIRQPISEAEVRRAIVPMAGRFEVFPHGEEFWLYQPALGEESEILILDKDEGELWAKTPGETFTALMIELAGYLGARVRGEELETYLSLDDVYIHPDDQAEWDLAYSPEARRLTRSRAARQTRHRLAMCALIAVVLSAIVLLLRHFA